MALEIVRSAENTEEVAAQPVAAEILNTEDAFREAFAQLVSSTAPAKVAPGATFQEGPEVAAGMEKMLNALAA